MVRPQLNALSLKAVKKAPLIARNPQNLFGPAPKLNIGHCRFKVTVPKVPCTKARTDYYLPLLMAMSCSSLLLQVRDSAKKELISLGLCFPLNCHITCFLFEWLLTVLL